MTGTRTRLVGCAHSAGAIFAEPADLGRLLLDSTVLIDALRGKPAAQSVAALRREGTEPWVCAISIEEIWRGVSASEEPAVRRFLTAYGSRRSARQRACVRDRGAG